MMMKMLKWVSAGIVCSVASIVAMIQPANHDLNISKEGLVFIAEREGCRRDVYKCAANTKTSGIGHTGNLKDGVVANDAQIALWLIDDIAKAESVVDANVDLPQGHVYDMAVSFVFNLGQGNFRRSTFLKKLKEADYKSACGEFTRWVYVDGKDCRIEKNNCIGIVSRREQEKEVCLNGYP